VGSQGVSGYAAVHARVRAMHASMLAPPTWELLCEASDLQGLIDILKETVYASYLEAVESARLTPRRTVYQVKQHLADVSVTTIGLVPEHSRPLLTQLYRLWEVDNLKAVLRGIAANATWDEVRYVLFPMESYNVLPAQEMVEGGSISVAVDLLRGTPYYDTLSHAMERYTAEQSLFPLEVALDLAYWRTLWRDATRLSGRDRERAMSLIGPLVDMSNLMWAIRYRTYHHLSEEEIINYTLPFGYRVHDQDIRSIAAGADITRVVGRIYPELVERGALSASLSSDLAQLERRLQQRIVERSRAAFLGYPFHVGIPIAYVLLNRAEIQDLTVLIEAKSSGMPTEGFLSYLVIGCGSEA
jgi:V/A-type H+-transporting ATPase subunit C